MLVDVVLNTFVFSVLHRYPVITKDLLPWEIAKAEVDELIATKQQEVSEIVLL